MFAANRPISSTSCPKISNVIPDHGIRAREAMRRGLVVACGLAKNPLGRIVGDVIEIVLSTVCFLPHFLSYTI